MNVSPNDFWHDEIEDSLQAIGSVVDFSGAPRVQVRTAAIKDHGSYSRDHDLIQIAAGTPRPRLTVVHEHGHVVDWHLFSDGFSKASNSADDPHSDLFEWWQGAMRSKACGDWEKSLDNAYLKDDAEYWLQPNEMLARSFAQFIASRTPDAKRCQRLRAELDYARSNPVRDGYWQDEDFEPVAQALARALKKRGVLLIK